MVVSLSQIKTSIWDTMYNFLQEGDYAISTDNIFSAINDKLVSDTGYPLVILEIPSTSRTRQSLSCSGNKTIEISMAIEVYHNSSANVKLLADEIENVIFTNAKVLSGFGIKGIEIDSSDYDNWTDAGKKVHRITLTVLARYTAEE